MSDLWESDLFLSRCLAIDLEVSKESRIDAFGAIRADTDKCQVYSGDGRLDTALAKLDDFADGASFVLGHNLISFDLPYLRAAKPDLRMLSLPAIDTLRLSPLAFPRNPYHSLVKHYQDGALKGKQLNDPKLDSLLALRVFRDQCQTLEKVEPGRLTAWHWLVTQEPKGADRALDILFSKLRGAHRPSDKEALAAIHEQLDGITCSTHRLEAVTANPSRWALAYALAWLSVSGDNSVMPPDFWDEP